MFADQDRSYALEIMPRFRKRLQGKGRQLADSEVKQLSIIVSRCSHLEKTLLYSAMCESFDRTFLRVLGAKTWLPNVKKMHSDTEHDLTVISTIYNRKLSNNIVGYQALHYYENCLRNAVSKYLSEKVSPNWHRDLLFFLASDFDYQVDPDTGERKVLVSGMKEPKAIIGPDLKDDQVLKDKFFDKVFTWLRYHFSKLALSCRTKEEIYGKIAISNVREFMCELSISEIQKWVLIDWNVFVERSDFSRAKSNRIHRKQLHSYFSSIAEYRNRTYHHASDGGASKAIRCIKKIIDVPKEYTKFLGPQIPVIVSPIAAREIADEIFSEMPRELRDGTSIQAIRYLAKRYPIDVLKLAYNSPSQKRRHAKPTGIGMLHRELEQYRPPGMKSVYAQNLEAHLRSKKDMRWVWWH